MLSQNVLSSDMIKHIIIVVTGKVQGVYYRASAAHKAKELGVDGLVRNQPDGSVYIEAEGSPEVLDELVKWCRKGPPSARVEQCIVSDGDLKFFSDFSIHR
jgi:acylphosphatase